MHATSFSKGAINTAHLPRLRLQVFYDFLDKDRFVRPQLTMTVYIPANLCGALKGHQTREKFAN